MKKACLGLMLFALLVSAARPAMAGNGPSQASAVSVMLTGSLVVAVSSIPLLALASIGDASVTAIKSSGKNQKDITVRQTATGKTAVVRVPEKALVGKTVRPGQKAEFAADDNGQMFKVDGEPIAYLPSENGQQLLRSKKVQ